VQALATAQPEPNDGQILELLAAGEAARAFEIVLARYEAKVFRLCCAILRERSLAEDTAQEALIRIWKALPRFDGRAAISTWIYTIARNRCMTALQRRRDFQSLSDPGVEHEAEAVTAVMPSAGDEPLALLKELVDELPERYRRTLTLYYYEERSVSEVALALGTAEGTVKTTLFRARAMLLQRLENLGMKDISQWLEPTT
jgi:RNA polymerase sigma-70 factor (ECF subfamily)